MIHITIQLDSAHGARHDRLLGTATIINDGTGTPTRGNYTVLLKTGKRGKARSVRVVNFPRKSCNAWELLRRALNTSENT